MQALATIACVISIVCYHMPLVLLQRALRGGPCALLLADEMLLCVIRTVQEWLPRSTIQAMYARSSARHLAACPLHHIPVDIPHVPRPAHWFSRAALPPPPTAPVLLWLHGGYYLTGSATMHVAPMTTWLWASDALQSMAILSLEYTLTPEAAFPTALQQSVRAYQWLLQQGHTRILIGGDSAGGNLALATLLTIQTLGNDSRQLSDPGPDHVPLARLVVQDIITHPTPWLQPAGGLLVSPRVSSVGRYPPNANSRDLLSMRVLRGASLLHVGLALPVELDRGLLQGLTPAEVPRGAAAALGLAPEAAKEEISWALLHHPLCTPLHASAAALGRLPPLLVTIGAPLGVGVFVCHASTGGLETYRADIEAFVGRVKQAGGKVQAHRGRDMFHVYAAAAAAFKSEGVVAGKECVGRWLATFN